MDKSDYFINENSPVNLFTEMFRRIKDNELVSIKEFTTEELLNIRIDKVRYLKEFTLCRHKGFYDEIVEPYGKRVFNISQASRWNASELDFSKDVQQWHNPKIIPEELKMFTDRNFKLFTQMDVEVAINYMHTYMMIFQEESTSTALAEINAVEGVHKDAYAKVMTTLDYPMSEFEEFIKIPVTKTKIDLLHKYQDINTLEDLITNMVVMSVLGEGILLFTMFGSLLYLRYIDRMPSMGTSNLWSARDESLHVVYISYLIKRIIKDVFGGVWPETLKNKIIDITTKLVTCEEQFISYIFDNDGVKFYAKDDPTKCELSQDLMLKYMKYMTDLRLCDINIDPLYGNYERKSSTVAIPVVPHPLPWLVSILSLSEHTDFFANTPTGYSKLDMGRASTAWAAFEESNNFKDIRKQIKSITPQVQ